MDVSSNRTIVELKPLYIVCNDLFADASNRTIVELKLDEKISNFTNNKLLIVPSWN